MMRKGKFDSLDALVGDGLYQLARLTWFNWSKNMRDAEGVFTEPRGDQLNQVE